MSPIPILLTTPLVNEYFGVGVTSEPRMASAGVEPRMGSSTDKHQFRSTAYLAHQLTCMLRIKSIRIIDVCRTVQVPFFPQRVFLTRFGRAPSMARLPRHPHGTR